MIVGSRRVSKRSHWKKYTLGGGSAEGLGVFLANYLACRLASHAVTVACKSGVNRAARNLPIISGIDSPCRRERNMLLCGRTRSSRFRPASRAPQPLLASKLLVGPETQCRGAIAFWCRSATKLLSSPGVIRLPGLIILRSNAIVKPFFGAGTKRVFSFFSSNKARLKSLYTGTELSISTTYCK
jgi:hypothetical protein